MGQSGIDVRAHSIRVTFTHCGRQYRRTLYMNGQPLAPTPTNLRYAERLAAEIRDRIRLGLFSLAEYFPASGDTASALTVERQLHDWLAAQRIEPSTRAGYDSAIRFWQAALPGKALTALKPSEIMRAIAARSDLSGKTVNNYVSVLRSALDLAIRDRALRDNPAAAIPAASHQRMPPDPFASDERDIIIKHFERADARLGNLVQFWAWTGLRTSELFALQWADCDLRSGAIQISAATVQHTRRQATKTSTARVVKLNSRALQALQAQRAHTYMKATEVFLRPLDDAPWGDPREFLRLWVPALRALKMRYRRPYNLRHTYATAMLMAGMTPAFCARQMGHSVEVFLRTYSKWIDGQQDDLEMARLERNLSANPGDNPGIKKGRAGA